MKTEIIGTGHSGSPLGAIGALMRRGRLKRYLIWAAVTAVGLMAVCGGLLIWALMHIEIRLGDVGTVPSARVFRIVFGQEVPKGVSDLVVAGRTGFQCQEVYMYFHATDNARHELIKTCRPSTRDQFEALAPAMSRRKAKRPSDDISGLLERDALKVHLDEALKSRNLAYCQKGVFPVTDDEWFSVIAVDKEKGLVYVIAVQ